MVIQYKENRIKLPEIKLEPIELSPLTKGVCVVAIQRSYAATKIAWVILIKSVKAEQDTFHITRHVSYLIGENRFFYDSYEGAGWGTSERYDFYLATKDIKKELLKIMKENKIKYISILNKLIRFE